MNTEEKETNQSTEETTTQNETVNTENTEEKIKELNDKYLRLYSEFDNFRKRTIKEKSDIYKSTTGEVFKAFLPVIDDFDRAIKSINEAQDVESLKEGVALIHSKFISTLKQKGLEEMTAQHQIFDADYHEAITEIPAPSDDLKGKIVDVIEKGYTLDGKIIRYAKVIVGK